MTNRGGARPGSGRKKMGSGKKQRITFTLADDVILFLKARRPAAQTLEKAIRECAQNLEKAAAAVDELGIAWNARQKKQPDCSAKSRTLTPKSNAIKTHRHRAGKPF